MGGRGPTQCTEQHLVQEEAGSAKNGETEKQPKKKKLKTEEKTDKQKQRGAP